MTTSDKMTNELTIRHNEALNLVRAAPWNIIEESVSPVAIAMEFAQFPHNDLMGKIYMCNLSMTVECCEMKNTAATHQRHSYKSLLVAAFTAL